MKQITLFLLLAACSMPALAQEYLEPDDTATEQLMPDSWHGSNYRELLKPAFDGSERVFAIVEPAFVPEFVIGLREATGSYEIFGAWPALTKDGRRIPEDFSRLARSNCTD